MRGIDDEEAFFLNEVDEQKLKRERERKQEERREVEEVKISFLLFFFYFLNLSTSFRHLKSSIFFNCEFLCVSFFHKALSSNCIETSSIPKINCTLPTNKKEKKQSDLLKSAVVLKRKMLINFFFYNIFVHQKD